MEVKIGDLVIGGTIRNRAIDVQPKTGRPIQFELLDPARGSIKQMGNLRAVQSMLGQTKIESTVRYLGVEVED